MQHWIRRVMIVAAIGALGTACGANSSSDVVELSEDGETIRATSTGYAVTMADHGRLLDVKVGEQIEVSLVDSDATGRWGSALAAEGTVFVRELPDSQVGPTGTPRLRQFLFEATRPTNGYTILQLKRSLGRSTTGTFNLAVRVEPAPSRRCGVGQSSCAPGQICEQTVPRGGSQPVGICVDAPTAARGCGTRGGISCGASEFCNFALYGQSESMCGTDGRGGRCEPRPTRCAREDAPVTACDGRSYPNACAANAAGATVRTRL